MTLWIILTIMTAAVAVVLSAPFIRRLDRPPVESAGDIEVYRDQLNEVESEQRQGLIDDAHAAAARLEIERRVLAADRMTQSLMPVLSGGERNFAVICVTGIVVLGSVGLYAATGNPDLPSARGSAATERASASFAQGARAIESLAAAMQTPTESQGQPRSQSGVPPVEEMIQRLATRLLQNPKDGEGWRTLGWSYLSVGRFSEASEAYAKAIELNPNVADIRSARVEALVRSADGIVTTDAGNAIEDTLKIDPGNARARFFKGLAREQGGDKAGALTDWIAVLRDADPAEAWVPDLKSRISELERNLGMNAAAPSTALKPAGPGGLLETPGAPGGSEMSSTVGKGPSAQDVQAAEVMPPAERSAMIRGMVDRLASRLEGSPRDADGWIKLIQSRMVLGETELAKLALARGVEAFTDDARQRDRIVAAAQQLGLNQ
ncbi:c-type cytochrome biogenesis protein CcmI [Bradyrhizobium sediminis]|uniref:C-type cytochrome biogenesis protein CcmI n=1 Tax=Bradyrhizobium sediminis TaxID=2840469 RepID=A0A975NLD6_9BRAD|nr:c-type cytochrome biogenesis protein CcmI [Bradyrhizobium sediminis]QWG17303.1 c-type cytochrome biogenesis protein CcmI [Bradyrhizobium sediminis]